MNIEDIKTYMDAVREELIAHCQQNYVSPSKIAHVLGLHHETVLRFVRGKTMSVSNVNKIETFLSENTRCKSCRCGHCEARKLLG